MLKKIVILTVAAVLCMTYMSYGQKSYPKEVKKLLQSADEYMDIEDYHNALPLYVQAEKLVPKDPQISFKAAKCLFELRH